MKLLLNHLCCLLSSADLVKLTHIFHNFELYIMHLLLINFD